MNIRRTALLNALAAASLAAAVAAPAYAQSACEAPKGIGERNACVKLKEGGVTALRQYVERTRMIHSLYMPDFFDKEEYVVASSEVPQTQPVMVPTMVAPQQTSEASQLRRQVARSDAKRNQSVFAKNTATKTKTMIAKKSSASKTVVAAAKPATQKLAAANTTRKPA